MRIISGWTLFLLLSGCAVSVYRPLDNGIGYTEVGLSKDRYEIMFHGTVDQDELTAKKFAMVRAAEIGKRNGFAYFVINKEKMQEKDEKQVTSVTDA